MGSAYLNTTSVTEKFLKFLEPVLAISAALVLSHHATSLMSHLVPFINVGVDEWIVHLELLVCGLTGWIVY